MASKIHAMISVALLATLAFTISCEAANAGQQHRKMLQYRDRNRLNNLSVNTLRSQASTSQAIEEAVLNGGSLGPTSWAGWVGNSGTYAVTQGNRAFNVVDYGNTYGNRYGNRYGKRKL